MPLDTITEQAMGNMLNDVFQQGRIKSLMVQINDLISDEKKELVSTVLIENKYEENGIWNIG